MINYYNSKHLTNAIDLLAVLPQSVEQQNTKFYHESTQNDKLRKDFSDTLLKYAEQVKKSEREKIFNLALNVKLPQLPLGFFFDKSDKEENKSLEQENALYDLCLQIQ